MQIYNNNITCMYILMPLKVVCMARLSHTLVVGDYNHICSTKMQTDAPAWYYIASSPAPSQLFSLAGKKQERAWDLKSRDKCWQNGVALALLQSVDFKPVWHLWSIKQSSARPLRIVLPSLIVSVAFFFTHIEPERSKIVLAHVQFSRSATLPTLVYRPTSRT